MEDLIYSFLLQSGYPRSSIVYDFDLVGVATEEVTNVGTPAFAIVDPDTAAPLAIVQVVAALDIDGLKQAAIDTAIYASNVADKVIQAFVIRVDTNGQSAEEQVQFYKVWPSSTLKQLTSQNFPDLDALRVSRMLLVNSNAPASQVVQTVLGAQSDAPTNNVRSEYADPKSQAGLFIPAILLLILMFADGIFNVLTGKALLTIPQSILALGVAALLTVPAAIRHLR